MSGGTLTLTKEMDALLQRGFAHCFDDKGNYIGWRRSGAYLYPATRPPETGYDLSGPIMSDEFIQPMETKRMTKKDIEELKLQGGIERLKQSIDAKFSRIRILGDHGRSEPSVTDERCEEIITLVADIRLIHSELKKLSPKP